MYDGRRGFDTDGEGWDLPQYDGRYAPPPGRSHQRKSASAPSAPVRGATQGADNPQDGAHLVARNAIVLFAVVVVVMILVLLLLRP